MDLWIRTQSRESLIKCNQLYIIKNYGMYAISNYILDFPNEEISIPYDLINIGTYKSKERALEVLDEIQKTIEEPYWARNEIEAFVISKNLNGKVYEMPKE